MSNRIVEYNVIRNTIGSTDGNAGGLPTARGIYVDGYGNNVTIQNNTILNCIESGIYLSFFTYNINLLNNTLYNNKYNLYFIEGDTIANNHEINGNILISSGNITDLMRANNTGTYNSAIIPYSYRPAEEMGTWNGNYYIKPFDDNGIFRLQYITPKIIYDCFTVNGWSQYDANMKSAPVIIAPYIIDSLVGSNKVSNGTYTNNTTGTTLTYYGTGQLTWDNTNKINGGSAKISYSMPLATQWSTCFIKIPIGAVEAGKKYICKFDILGTKPNRAIAARLALPSTNTPLTPEYKYYPYTNTGATTNEILFEPTASATSTNIYLTLRDEDSTVYIDNITLYEAIVTKANPDDLLRFEYNATNNTKTIPLDNTYIGIDSTIYTNNLILLPYTSALLFKNIDTNSNLNPNINNQGFQIPENSPNGSFIGTVLASDPDTNQVLTYSILSGNVSGAVAIDSLTGILTVAYSNALNFEVTPTISLLVEAEDSGIPSLSSQATVTISLIDVNEAPAISNQSFTIVENSANGSSIGTVVATDPDAGQTKTFSILSGNTNGAFTIHPLTGMLTVANSAVLNFETTPSFSLIIKVQDNGTGNLSSQATITISITDVNEVPVINNQSFSIAENSPNGSNVGIVVAADPDAGQTKTYSIVSGNTNAAFSINASSGMLTVTNSSALNFEVLPSFALVIKVQDNGAGNLSSQATITVTLTNINEPPVIVNQLFSIAENSPNGSIVGTVVASDPDAGQSRIFSIASGNTAGAFSINAANGLLTVSNSAALNFEIVPSFSLVIMVQDNGVGNLSSQATITVSLLDLNESPVVNNQSFNAQEYSPNGTSVGTILAIDQDAGQALSYSIISGNTNNAFLVNSISGELTVNNSSQLNFSLNPSISLTVKVTDNGLGNLFDEATITINVIQSANQPPVINNQSFSLTENPANGTIVGTVLASDPDAGQNLEYTILSGNTNGAFLINSSTGVISAANSAAIDFETANSFSLLVKVEDDGIGNLSSQALISISLLDVNEAPVIQNQSFTINENSLNGTQVGIVTATDPDAGQTFTFSILSGNVNGCFTINPSSGSIIVSNSGELDFETGSTYALNINVQDNGAGSLSNQAVITISLIDVNEAPVINNQAFSVSENSPNGTFVGIVAAADPDQGQTTTFSIVSGNSNGAFSIDASTGLLSVANSTAINYEVESSFALSVNLLDNGNVSLSSQATITVSLSDVNEEPQITNQSFTVAENSVNSTYVGTVIASDPDAGQTLAFSILSGNSFGAFAINPTTGALTVANSSSLNFEIDNSFELTIKIQDNGTGNLSNQANITVSLIDLNETPSINDQSFSVLEFAANGTSVGNVVATDPDINQTISYTIISGNTNNAFTLSESSGEITVNNTTAINYLANPTYSLSIKATDNGTGNLSDVATITINVLQYTNQPPVINNQSFTITENSTNGTLVGLVNASDPDPGQLITYTIISGNTGGAFSLNPLSGVLTIANSTQLNFEDTPVFSLVVNAQDNGIGNLFSQATVTVTLLDQNEAPIINNQAFTAIENSINGTFIGTVVADDPDAGQTSSFSIISGNINGTFSINSSNGVISVSNSSGLNYENIQTFALTVQVADNGVGSLSSQAVVTINVLNINEPPVVNNQSYSVMENSPNGTIVGSFTASDPDAGQTLAYSILSGNINNDFVINATTGVIAVANSLNLNYETTTSFSLLINVQDNGTGNLSSHGVATISLIDQNEPPSISNQQFSVNENSSNGTIVGNVVATDPDFGQNTTFSIISGNVDNAFGINALTGTVSVSNSGALNFELTPSYSLVVSVQDNGSGNLSSQAIVLISLTDLNEAPIVNNQSFGVAENSPNGTYLGTIIASDPDAGQILSYSIQSGNTFGAFSIDALTGQLSVANSAALDFELTSNFELVVQVQDNSIAELTDQAAISVSLIDVNESPVVNNQTFSISEFSANGLSVGIVSAMDPDDGQTLSFSIVAGNTNNAFAINNSTGEITVNESLELNYQVNPNFVLLVNVSDNGTGNLSDDAEITINITPIINIPPVINNQSFVVDENSSNGTIVGIVEASDPNSGQLISYSIIDGNNDGAFTINPSTGELTVSNSDFLDFETNPVFHLTIRVLDNGVPSLSSQATVSVLVVDTNEPPLISDQYFTTPEHQPAGSQVGIVTASDPDSGKPVVFLLTSGNNGNGFALDPNTGLLTINNPNAVCFEGNPEFYLYIKAVDNEGFSTEAMLSINVTDINENPVCQPQYFTVEENAPVQTIVGTVIANEPDFNQTLTYSIVSGNQNNAFSINSNDGLLTVNNSSELNFEENHEYKLTIVVQDNGDGNLTTFTTVIISLVDMNEPPTIVNQVFSVIENSPTGTEIGKVVASDPDGQQVSYTVVSGNEFNTFSINDYTGLLTVSDPALLIYGLFQSFTLNVKVIEIGGDSLSSISTVTINLLQETSGMIVYIDPANENDPSENGSITHPYDSWDDVFFAEGYTYLQKRGTTFKATNPIRIEKANITIDAYNSGSNPIIYFTEPFENAIELHNTENCIISNMDISFDNEGQACIYISGDLSKNLTIENCSLHNALYGINSVSQIKELKILNTNIFSTVLDGILAYNFESIEIGKCEIFNVNQRWFTNPNALGSCISLDSEQGKVNIFENVLDHSTTGNMFVARLNGTFMEGLIEKNTLRGRIVSGNHCLGINNVNGTFIVRYNTITDGETGINSNTESNQIYYNQFIGNAVAIKVQQNKSANVMNNTFYNNENYAIESLSGSKVISKNNIFYLTPLSHKAYKFGGAFVSDYNLFNVEKSGFLNDYSTLPVWSGSTGQDNHSLVTDPIFINISGGDFRVKPNSPCINKGTELDLENDFFSTQVPQANLPDIGFHEVKAETILPGVEAIPVAEDNSLIDISVYPNPTIGLVKISFEKTDDQPVDFRIVNLNGYEVYATVLDNQEEVSINLEDEKPGLYMAVLTIDGQVYTRKIIVQN
jgi:parallel beta-helix repeat protein